MTVVLAEIPYTTFPTIDLGFLELRTFGFVVAIGVLLGAWLAARHGERYGVSRDATYSLAMRMVLAGVVGARLTWVLSHLEDIDGPIDVIAVWEGGLQFSGGFLAAIIVGFPVYRRWNRLTRWHSLDGYAYGLAIGLAIGRIACYSVGEHFGRQTSFFLGVRYEGGSVREATLGDVPLREGLVFHQTALYELLYLVVLFVVLTWLLYLRKERPPAGVGIGVFCAWYGVCRFASDSLRVNDERVLMMTGAQYFALALIPAALWIFLRVRKQLDADVAAGLRPGLPDLAVAGAGSSPAGSLADAAEGAGSAEAPDLAGGAEAPELARGAEAPELARGAGTAGASDTGDASGAGGASGAGDASDTGEARGTGDASAAGDADGADDARGTGDASGAGDASGTGDASAAAGTDDRS